MFHLILTLISSQPDSSATIVGAVKGYDTKTPFSVPTQREEWAATRVEIWMGMWLERFSLPNTERKGEERGYNKHREPKGGEEVEFGES